MSISTVASSALEFSSLPCPSQVVTFRVDNRAFGVDVSVVREIKGWQPTTPLPNAAPQVLGVLNLRGNLIAVYDLRKLIGLGDCMDQAARVVLVVDLGERMCGIVADAVSDILDVDPSDMRPSPAMFGDEDLVSRFVVRGENVISLLNVQAITREASPQTLQLDS